MWFVVKVFFLKVHKDPSNEPLKPFKKGLQRCPPKLPCQTQKKNRIMLPKKPLKRCLEHKNKSVKGERPPSSLPETKTKVWKKFTQRIARNRKFVNLFSRNCPKRFLKERKKETAHPNPKSAPAFFFLFLFFKVKLIPSPIFGLTSPLFEFHPQSGGLSG